MANYISINSKFKPFSYSELLQPIAQSTAAHQELENEYTNIATKANIWEGLADQQKDSYSYNLYKKFSDDLANNADLLAKEGLNHSNRRGMLEMKQRYSSEILPIELGYKKREEEIKRQQDIYDKDKSIMFSRDARTTSLDDYVRGKETSYTQISGNELYNKANSAGKALSSRKVLPDSIKSDLGNQYWKLTQEKGYSSEDALNWIKDNSKSPELTDAIDRIKREYDLQSLGESDRNKADNTIIDGLLSGLVYDKDVKYQSNKAYDYAMQERARRSSLEREAPSQESPFGARILIGASGEPNKELIENTKGLRDTGEGIATNSMIDDLNRQKSKYTNIINSYDQGKLEEFYNYENQPKSNQPYDSEETLGARMVRETNTPKGYHEFKKAQSEVNILDKKINEKQEYINNLADKYSYLPGTQYDKVNLGAQLENSQNVQEHTRLPLSIKDAEYKKITTGISHLLGNFTRKELDSKNLGLFKLEDGKETPIDYDDTKSIIDDSDNMRISVDSKDNLLITYNGEHYKTKGILQLDNYNKKLDKVNNYLKDYSKSSLSKLPSMDITKEQLQEIYNGNARSIDISINTKSIKDKDGNYLVMLKEPTSGEIVKVMLDPSGNVILGTLFDELNGGSLRDSYFMEAAAKGLSELPGLVAK